MPVLPSFIHSPKIDPSLLGWGNAVGYSSLKDKGLDPTAPIGGSAFGGGTGFSGSGAGGGTGIEHITQLVNEINQAAQQKANAGRIPDETVLEQESSGNIGSALRGEVDPSTINLLGQQAAERGVSTGNPMGANSNAAYLRALGLTSLDRMNTGQDWLSRATARNPAAPIYDAGNQVLTAAQLQQAILAREQMRNNLEIARMHYANPGRGGGGANVNVGRTGTLPSPVGGSNYAELFPASKGGWSFPPGYDSIPVGGTQTGMTDQQFVDQWFPTEDYWGSPDQSVGLDSGGNVLNDQLDFDWSSLLGDYGG